MTDEEARNIMGETVAELASQRSRLTCLKAKAGRMRKLLDSAVYAMDHALKPEQYSQPRVLPSPRTDRRMISFATLATRW